MIGISSNKLPEIDEKVDIYALGLILLELSSNVTTAHEKITSFSLVKEKRQLPKQNKTLASQVEGELILALTEKDPRMRPSAV